MSIVIKTTLFLSFLFFLLYKNKPNKDRSQTYIIVFLLITTISLIVLFMIFTKTPFLTNKIFAVLVPIGVITVFYFIDKAKKDAFKILAKQESFWGVSPEQIVEKYKHRVVPKKGRNEIDTIPETYFFKKDEDNEKQLNNLIYMDIKKYNRFTFIDSINFFKSDKASTLYKTLYAKFIDLNEDFEAGVDFEKVLEENNFCLQFFILDCWKRLAQNEVLGTATLEVLAVNQKELDLIGAMDSEKNSNVQKGGVELFAHYAYFKNRLRVA